MIKLALFLKKYFIFIIAIALLIGVVFLKWLKRKPTDQTTNASSILDSLSVPEQDKQFFNKRAIDVSHHLGTAYPQWDPRFWAENDEEVFNLLKDMTVYDMEKISLLYFEVYAKGRTLSADLAKLLDAEYYEQLNNI